MLQITSLFEVLDALGDILLIGNNRESIVDVVDELYLLGLSLGCGCSSGLPGLDAAELREEGAAQLIDVFRIDVIVDGNGCIAGVASCLVITSSVLGVLGEFLQGLTEGTVALHDLHDGFVRGVRGGDGLVGRLLLVNNLTHAL